MNFLQGFYKISARYVRGPWVQSIGGLGLGLGGVYQELVKYCLFESPPSKGLCLKLRNLFDFVTAMKGCLRVQEVQGVWAWRFTKAG